MKLSQIGETKLIERIERKIRLKDPLVIAGIGDDAAVVKSPGKNYTLLTVDMLIENVHFTAGKMSFHQIGHKALAVNLSDIAAMGGLAKFCLVSLGLPRGMSVENIDEIYDGILSLAREFHVEVLGGDTNNSPSELIIDICVIGEVEPEFLCLRSGARPGDSILVTGKLGGAAHRLSKGKYLPPTPRIKEARAIVENAKVNAMIDLSDGLGKDLHAIADSSKVGALIYADRIPLSPGTDLDSALGGGEDYELLFTVPPEQAEELLIRIPKKTGTPLTLIGEITEKDVSIKHTDGKISLLPPRGYEHLK